MKKPFKKCDESCPLFGYHKRDDDKYCCFIGGEMKIAVNRGDSCHRKMNLAEKRMYMREQHILERERDKITTKIYHLQLLIDNCGSE